MRDYFDWTREAACLGAEDPNLYCRPKDDYDVKEAKRVCQLRCPVRQECLMHAIIYGETGVWGGFSEKERYPMSQRIRPQLIQLASRAGVFHPELMRDWPQAA